MKPPEVRKYLFDMAEAFGEALGRLLEIAPELSERISDSRRIISFRNRLIHGYASLADDIVWGIVEGNLPKLTEEIQQLFEED